MPFSVLLAVYIKENPAYLHESLSSIWDQQLLRPGQVVLVEDGALTPELDFVVAEWKLKLGEVLTLVSLAENVGLGAALNKGLQHCEHELVARMDTDDIAMPTRFKKQMAFMLQNPDIAASSAQIEEWNPQLTQQLDQRTLPTEPVAVRIFAKRRSPLSHPVSILRKTVVLEVGGYPPLRKAQDCALWSLLLVKGYKLANLPDMLLKMRTGDELLNRRGWAYFKQELQLLKFQKRIGFLTRFEFLTNITLRAILRLSPNILKNIVYRAVR